MEWNLISADKADKVTCHRIRQLSLKFFFDKERRGHRPSRLSSVCVCSCLMHNNHSSGKPFNFISVCSV